MELGWAQHLLQPWTLGWMAWRVLSPAAVLSSTAGAVCEPSRIRRQLGISSAELSATDVGEPAGVQPSWLWSAGLPSGPPSLWASREPAGRFASGDHSGISSGRTEWESSWEWESSGNRSWEWESSWKWKSSGNGSWESREWKSTRRWSGWRTSAAAGAGWKTDTTARTGWKTLTASSCTTEPSCNSASSYYAAGATEPSVATASAYAEPS
jgi:hypothetical protein